MAGSLGRPALGKIVPLGHLCGCGFHLHILLTLLYFIYPSLL